MKQLKIVEESPEITREYLVLNKEDYTEKELENLEEHSVHEENLTEDEREKMEDIIENNRVVRPALPVTEEPVKRRINILWIIIPAFILLIIICLVIWLLKKKGKKQEEYVEFVDIDEDQDLPNAPREGQTVSAEDKVVESLTNGAPSDEEKKAVDENHPETADSKADGSDQ